MDIKVAFGMAEICLIIPIDLGKAAGVLLQLTLGRAYLVMPNLKTIGS